VPGGLVLFLRPLLWRLFGLSRRRAREAPSSGRPEEPAALTPGLSELAREAEAPVVRVRLGGPAVTAPPLPCPLPPV